MLKFCSTERTYRNPTTPNFVRIAQGACRYCITFRRWCTLISCYLQRSKNGFFAPQGRHVVSINVKFGVKERAACPLHRAKFHVYRDRNVGIQPQKLLKFRILVINLPLRGDSFAVFYDIVSICTRLGSF